MRTNLTRKDVTNELIDLVTQYLAVRVVAEVIRKEVDKVQRAVLAGMALTNDSGVKHGLPAQTITDPSQTYTCMDDVLMAQYYQEVDSRLRRAKLKPDDMELDYCPALVAEHAQVKAEWAILDEAARMLDTHTGKGELNNGLLYCENGLETRQEFIDLTVGLVLSL